MTVPADLRARIESWIDLDPDPVTVAEARDLLDREDPSLEERFTGRLTFGTAGLRAPLGAGPQRMNRAVVRQAAAGLCRYLAAEGAPAPRVAVGFDARHGSEDFAEDTAGVVAAAGGEAIVLPGPLPTPVLAFAVRHLDADAGVMVTASHNPPADNGYKVYLGDGAQIVPPSDEQISAHIEAVAAAGLPEVAPPDHPAISRLGPEIVDDYLAALDRLSLTADRQVLVAYTAMHGVGRDTVRDGFARWGFRAPVEVEAQVEPDPDFSTVDFPNPEEPGALDLGLATAQASGADLLVANDPDADRLGVAVPGRAEGDRWRALSGNEIGALLADHVLSHTQGDDRLVVTTIVSSRLLAAMAADHGVHHAETLTGFKWIVRAGLDRPDLRLVFGYEEALGYLVGDVVLDKDGVGAALAFAELVAGLQRQGRTVHDRLDDLADRYGLHRTSQVSVRLEGPEGQDRIDALMAGLRTAPPNELGGVPVESVVDHLTGPRDLPPTDAVVLHLRGGARVVVRPSGTEPKVKAYVEVVGDRADGDEVDAAVARIEAAVRELLQG